ncbi:MAG: guanylate kinase [Clostridia bacterium]|nr:guanylate kinase [Clostridia bacterium]MBQ8759742.1 guanylate kinase [Clostridia bacterium]
MNNTKRGRLVVVSGPSGVGKGTVLKYVLDRDDFVYSVSATTRSPREGEVDGVNYFFITREKFENMISGGEFIEYAEYNGNYYGTPKFFVEKMLSEGKNVILEIEVKGAMQVKRIVPEATFVFIAPESIEILEARLRGRGTEQNDVIAGRLSIAEREIRSCLMYDYIVINRDGGAEDCAEDIVAAVKAEGMKPCNVYTSICDFFK